MWLVLFLDCYKQYLNQSGNPVWTRIYHHQQIPQKWICRSRITKKKKHKHKFGDLSLSTEIAILDFYHSELLVGDWHYPKHLWMLKISYHHVSLYECLNTINIQRINKQITNGSIACLLLNERKIAKSLEINYYLLWPICRMVLASKVEDKKMISVKLVTRKYINLQTK